MTEINNPIRSIAPSSDGPSDSSSNSQQAFRLIAQHQNTDSQHMNPEQVLRALYEGSLTHEEIIFSLIENNSEENADFHDSFLPVCQGVYESPTNLGIPMGISKQGKIVTITCNPSIISVNEDCEESDVQANFLKGGPQC